MIQMNNVHVTFPGGLTALHPTLLSLRQGEFTVLLGSSGAGKSTLLRSLNQLTPSTGGCITVEGLGNLENRSRLHEHRKRTGMIFQQHQLIGRQTALANVMLGRIGYHNAWRSLFPLPLSERRIALESLERVGLLHKALERADKLSGGQQQRVGIARALAQQPRLMLADEPVASLDPATAHKILALLQRIGREDGITTVVSLHQVDLARTYADRVIGLAQGRVIFDGAPDGLTPVVLQALYQQTEHSVVTPAPTVTSPIYEFATIEN